MEYLSWKWWEVYIYIKWNCYRAVTWKTMFKNTRTEAKGNVNLETEIMNLSSGLQQKKNL